MTLLITLPGSQPKTYQQLDAAKTFADKKATELGIELEVRDQESGTVAYLTSPRAIAKRETGQAFVPWTRLETPTFSTPAFDGYYVAYTRKRIEATVLRAYDPEAVLPWRVFDGRTKNFRDVKNTTESRLLLTAMKQGLML